MGTNWRYHKLYRRTIQTLCSKLYRDTDRDTQKSIVIAGTARSGTTWLADVIASQLPCRIMFEPFHPRLVAAFSRFHYFQYMRPTEQNSELLSYCQKIFTGDIRHGWIDRQVEHLFPQYRLIKEIRANLFLKWIHNGFPEIPLLFIIRHPCAVVLSRMQLGWATDTDIDPFLSQPKLIEDFLSDKMTIIECAKTEEEKHAIIWCISNVVPLKQFHADRFHIVFYENLYTQPLIEIPKIFQTINQSFQESVFESLVNPSVTTTRSSALMTGENNITHWRKDLSAKQINNILSVVEAFGLGHLYGDSPTPLTTSVGESS